MQEGKIKDFFASCSLSNLDCLVANFSYVFAHSATSSSCFPVLSIIVKLIRLSLGGLAMGLAFGLIATLFLSFLYEAFEVEVSITLVVAFLGFWTAQAPAVLSGVICNVASGIVLGAFGKQLISPSVRDPLRRFWILLSWIANTIVFVYAGLLVVSYIWTCSGDPLEWYDYVHILSWYAYLNVLRFGLIFLSHPMMKWGQPWYGFKQATVLSFSGLRGAVTLILALEVGESQDLNIDVRSRIVVWSSAFVALTLFINGSMIKQVLSLLHLDKPDPIKQVRNSSYQIDGEQTMVSKEEQPMRSMVTGAENTRRNGNYCRNNCCHLPILTTHPCVFSTASFPDPNFFHPVGGLTTVQEFLWRARATMLTRTYEILDAISVNDSFKSCFWSVAAKAVRNHDPKVSLLETG